MKVEFRIPIEHADSFRTGLLRFLERHASTLEEAFMINHAEPAGRFMREQVYFESADLALAFTAYWSSGCR